MPENGQRHALTPWMPALDAYPVPADEADDADVARALGALAQPHRLRAFRALVVAGEQGLTPGTLCQRLGLSPASMSFHLKALAAVGLVSVTRDGRHLVYRAGLARAHALLDFLTAHCCGGQPCVLRPAVCADC